jgi:hypothetical protein
MNRIRLAAFVVAVLSVILSASAAEKDPGWDAFGIGLDFTTFCDLKPGAPLSEPCRTFVGAVIEIVEANNLISPEFRDRVFPATCIPRGSKIEDIVEAIRPKLQVLICAGFCTSTSFVMSALATTYPCR